MYQKIDCYKRNHVQKQYRVPRGSSVEAAGIATEANGKKMFRV